MNEREVAAIMQGVAPVMRQHFDALSARLLRDAEASETVRAAEFRAFMAEQRADAVERRVAVETVQRQIEERLATLKDGRDGVDGAPGRDGIDGKDGADGLNGADGRDGVDGQDGAVGADGRDGIDGKDGADGLNGEAGAPGRDGVDGTNGRDGADGISGKDGRDGIDGRDGADAYHGEARGLFDAEAIYRALDVVSFNGCEWRAKCDDPGELPGAGWMLSASKGKRGDRGEKGDTGKRGEPGAGILAAYVDTAGLQLVLTKDDGSEVKADLYDLANILKSN